MSLLAVQGGATGTGTVTLLAPVTNTNRTLTLPDATDTVAGIAATQTLTNKSIVATQLTGTVAAARLPAGSVLQVVSATTSAATSTTSSTYQSTGISASITPTSATSKIFVSVQTTLAGVSSNWADLGLFRGATALYGSVSNTGVYSLALDGWASASVIGLDSPATISSTTYEAKLRSRNNSTQVRVNPDSMLATIILMEIAA